MRFLELFESVLNFIFTKDGRYTLFGIVILFVEYVPTRRLGELCDDGKQYDEVYMDGNDGYSPSLLAFLPSVCVRITLRMNAMLRRGCWPRIFVRGLRRGRRLLAFRRNRQGQQHRHHLKQELVSIHPVVFCLWLHVRQILTNS